MRAHKYRAWNKLAQKMAVIDALDFALDSYRAHTSTSSGSGHLADIELMEFVGIHDGKEIWEGDIIHLTRERRNKQETSPVYWDGEKACYGPFHHFIDDEDRWIDVDYEVEVVGTIWEHPELVKKKNKP